MSHHIDILEWDTEFFGFRVGRISGPVIEDAQVEHIQSLVQQRESKLTYLSSAVPLPESIHHIHGLDISLVDRKTTYVKKVDSGAYSSWSIASLQAEDANETLLQLAIQSGVYSRFNVDQRISQERFEELYRRWMINSLNRTIAKDVLVVRVEQDIAGFVTIGEKNQRADIGIIAVDGVFRGQGLGRSLMKAAEHWAHQWGYDTIQVVTQGENIPACQLYESCGYQVDSIEFFYHIWTT